MSAKSSENGISFISWQKPLFLLTAAAQTTFVQRFLNKAIALIQR
jgi:hypothetical protein